MGSGCGDPIAEILPSSSGQLPVPVALHARSPTLFMGIIHDGKKIVKSFFAKFYQQARARRKARPESQSVFKGRSIASEELYTYTV